MTDNPSMDSEKRESTSRNDVGLQKKEDPEVAVELLETDLPPNLQNKASWSKFSALGRFVSRFLEIETNGYVT